LPIGGDAFDGLGLEEDPDGVRHGLRLGFDFGRFAGELIFNGALDGFGFGPEPRTGLLARLDAVSCPTERLPARAALEEFAGLLAICGVTYKNRY
jgi:hypothetical protein